MMPSPYTSDMSQEDAYEEAQALGVHYSTILITDTVNSIEAALASEFRGTARDTTEENIQARVRGVLLMALSNKTGKLVLTTGNKTEMAVGYATLYGDMAGGFSAIKDVPKLLVYKLSRYRNSRSPVIPERVLTRPPTAELRANQTDQDSLPPYDVLDAILELYVEQDRSAEDIARTTGASLKTIREVIRMVTRNEYKRRQAAPGVRISQRAFGRDRRYPITSGFKEPSPD
jgi:NAD+ synthase (glutamine-hydrolysing)